jgi:hypothetical protein
LAGGIKTSFDVIPIHVVQISSKVGETVRVFIHKGCDERPAVEKRFIKNLFIKGSRPKMFEALLGDRALFWQTHGSFQHSCAPGIFLTMDRIISYSNLAD